MTDKKLLKMTIARQAVHELAARSGKRRMLGYRRGQKTIQTQPKPN